ncbi:MAG TPA: response regulator [Candidatus Latescibacteria bacterium]|nr:response regulator [Candidatus Handelsmanbacteria bacterium]HIL08918.1 response regulator [Candidatus Latescibacterota bacterium]
MLIVDDEVVVRESTYKLLERNGYRVFVIEGVDAAELATREQVNLVLLALSMPVISAPKSSLRYAVRRWMPRLFSLRVI